MNQIEFEKFTASAFLYQIGPKGFLLCFAAFLIKSKIIFYSDRQVALHSHDTKLYVGLNILWKWMITSLKFFFFLFPALRYVFEGTANCEVIHGVLYSCLRALFGLSVIGILVCIFSCMLVYQLQRYKVF